MDERQIARVCHEANRAYCIGLGDDSQIAWEDAPDWQKDSCTDGVRFHLEHPHAKDEDSHNVWLQYKKATGWSYGEQKDAVLKTHPCIVPFDQLPKEQQLKDSIFRLIVATLRELVK